MNGHIIHATKFSTDINMFQTVAENQRLGKNDLRIFLFLCCRIGSQHIYRVDIKQMSETLGIKKDKIEDSLELLEDEGIITRGGDEFIKSGYKMVYTK